MTRIVHLLERAPNLIIAGRLKDYITTPTTTLSLRCTALFNAIDTYIYIAKQA